MTSLRDVCREIRGARPPALRLPEIPSVTVVSKQFGERVGYLEQPRAKDLDEVAAHILDQIRGGEGLSSRELRESAWCLWETSPALATEKDVLDELLMALARSERPRAYRSFAASYLASFDAGLPGISTVVRVLGALAGRAGQPWNELHRELSLFDLSAGPEHVAKRALADRCSPTEVLQATGLRALDATSGFARACVQVLLRHLAEGAIADPDERLEHAHAAAIVDGRLRFEEQGPDFAGALVRPFAGATPDKAIRDRYLDVLLSLFGDPRLYPARWSRIPEAKSVILGWLTEQSLRQFLDVVDRVAVERMWKYRRAFWEAVYDAGLIEEAWVAFAPSGAAEARRAFGKTTSFASLYAPPGRQVEAGHAVLLLRIGGAIVAEWSHNGRCNIWSNPGMRDMPSLYRRNYSSDELRHGSEVTDAPDGPRFAVAHHHPETLSWQRKVSEKIYRMTGIRIRESQYRIP
ncbi:EH signature domain-containing protein [Afifella sp. IM 167]|uniref:EH signature domain-containing protein n=1 Tax=Afifella sp. IM 167 TaxID=2033586 RepID=UPI001CCC8768|nr:EH signature domain-containing protein [Afifella sp. IM 167]MBZ8134380.1 hypothetical protein [Afifella sp. IM 167]